MSEANGKTFDLKEWIKHHVTDLAAYGGLIVCLIIFSVLPPMFGENLWSAEKLSTLMANVIVTALMSVGAVFVYSMGHMDISIGGQVRIYATLMVLLGNMTGSLVWGIIPFLSDRHRYRADQRRYRRAAAYFPGYPISCIYDGLKRHQQYYLQ